MRKSGIREGKQSTKQHPWHACWPCRLSSLGILVMLLVVFTILPWWFFTNTIRKLQTEFQPSVFADNVWNPSDLINVQLFKKQPRDRGNGENRNYSLEPNVCSGDPASHPRLVVFIPSRPDRPEERAAIRETWGVHARLCNVRVVFGFGSFESQDLFIEVRTENGLYGDLLQASSVVDAYHNQTRLVLSLFEWGSHHCQGAKFIGKADEDAWINIFGVLKYLQLPEANGNSVIGHFLFNETVKREVKDKWFVTKAEYPNSTYPPFPNGQLYIFPQTAVPSVLSVSNRLTIHWLDDVFIGGQIPELLNMSLVHIKEHAHFWDVYSKPCLGRKYFIIHATSASRKRTIFYEPCMETYRKESCQAHLTAAEGSALSESSLTTTTATFGKTTITALNNSTTPEELKASVPSNQTATEGTLTSDSNNVTTATGTTFSALSNRTAAEGTPLSVPLDATTSEGLVASVPNDQAETEGTPASVLNNATKSNETADSVRTNGTAKERTNSSLVNIATRSDGTTLLVPRNQTATEGTSISVLNNATEPTGTADLVRTNETETEGTNSSLLNIAIRANGTTLLVLGKQTVTEGTRTLVLNNARKSEGTTVSVRTNHTTMEGTNSTDLNDQPAMNGTTLSVLINATRSERTTVSVLRNLTETDGTAASVRNNEIITEGTANSAPNNQTGTDETASPVLDVETPAAMTTLILNHRTFVDEASMMNHRTGTDATTKLVRINLRGTQRTSPTAWTNRTTEGTSTSAPINRTETEGSSTLVLTNQTATEKESYFVPSNPGDNDESSLPDRTITTPKEIRTLLKNNQLEIDGTTAPVGNSRASIAKGTISGPNNLSATEDASRPVPIDRTASQQRALLDRNILTANRGTATSVSHIRTNNGGTTTSYSNSLKAVEDTSHLGLKEQSSTEGTNSRVLRNRGKAAGRAEPVWNTSTERTAASVVNKGTMSDGLTTSVPNNRATADGTKLSVPRDLAATTKSSTPGLNNPETEGTRTTARTTTVLNDRTATDERIFATSKNQTAAAKRSNISVLNNGTTSPSSLKNQAMATIELN